MPPRVKTARPVAQLRQGRTDWYRIENLGTGSAAIYVYDEIGYWGVTAADFVAELSELTGVSSIDLHINSPGGEVFEGLAIMNCLRSHPASVTTYVDGIAASIASVIAMAGDRIVMGPHSQLMIHEGSGLCVGDAEDMRKMADLLDFQSNNIAGVYQARAGGTVETWRAAMVAETWYTAEEAVAAGLADEVAPGAAPAATTVVPGEEEEEAGGQDAMANSWDLSIFRYAGRSGAPEPVAKAAEPAAPVVADAAEAMRKIHAAAQKPEPVVAESETPEPVVPEPEPVHDQADDSVTATADVSWAHLTAHLTEPGPDDWAALTAHLTDPQRRPSAATNA